MKTCARCGVTKHTIHNNCYCESPSLWQLRASIRRETIEEAIRAIDDAFMLDEDVAPQDVLRILAAKGGG